MKTILLMLIVSVCFSVSAFARWDKMETFIEARSRRTVEIAEGTSEKLGNLGDVDLFRSHRF